ncbi:hypothetical protein SZ46_06890 [Brachyspira hyodysenteriae]|nr:hypothetical protein SZ46_06890 [Brachyspira hyodysenteriae]
MWQQKKWGMGQSPRYKNKNINLFLTKYSCLGIYCIIYIECSLSHAVEIRYKLYLNYYKYNKKYF